MGQLLAVRYFASRFRRLMTAGFAGDAAPAGGQVLNNPTTGAGVLFRMAPRLHADPSTRTKRLQGYLRSNVVGILCDLQLWISAGDGTAANDWIAVGDPDFNVPVRRLWESAGLIMNPDAFVQITPSVPLGAGETLEFLAEESE